MVVEAGNLKQDEDEETDEEEETDEVGKKRKVSSYIPQHIGRLNHAD